MKHRFFFLLILLLGACSTTPTPNSQPDLFVEALQARATSEAALETAQFQENFLTATAQAPIIHITETAAAHSQNATTTSQALAMQQQYWTVTAQSIQETQTAAMTATANSWTATANSWTATPNATSTAVFAALNAQSTYVALDVERAQTTNMIKAFWLYVVGGIVLVLAILFAYVEIRRLSFMAQPVDERGKATPMIGVIDGVAWDIERSANGVIGTNMKFLKQLPQITGERQDAVTARSQMVDAATRSKLPRRLLESQGQGLLPLPSIESNFLLPSWDIINGWDGKGIPYYTANGLDVIDIEKFPHLSAIGVTGAGKSRRFFRPLIACALAGGQRVVILGKSADYWPFAHHPNATLLKLNKITEAGQAERYARILEAIVQEMNRRDDVLTAAHQSTWTHAGRNRTFLILDELGNALRLMKRETSNQCRIWVEGLVSESRKVGFNVVLANQRATGMASILSQTGKAIFRIEADEERAHRSLAGASTLSDGYFLAKFGASKLAGAFEPTDEELQAFLASRPVDTLDDDEWIDTVVSEPGQLPEEPRPALPVSMTLKDFLQSLNDQEAKIIDLHIEGRSNRQIELAVFGGTGGQFYTKVAGLIRRYKELNNTSATTTLSQNLPHLDVVPAQ
jgi:hypothetical protein